MVWGNYSWGRGVEPNVEKKNQWGTETQGGTESRGHMAGKRQNNSGKAGHEGIPDARRNMARYTDVYVCTPTYI